MNNHTIQPVSLKEHAQMQFIHQKRLSDALQLQADVNKKNYDQMTKLGIQPPSKLHLIHQFISVNHHLQNLLMLTQLSLSETLLLIFTKSNRLALHLLL